MNQDHLLIGATFTANALEGYLLGNAQFRDCAQSVSFIPSSQLLQTLLSDPKQDRPAKLIVMLRLSDLLRHERIDGPGWQARLDENARLYQEAIEAWQARTAGELWLLVVPESSLLAAEKTQACSSAGERLRRLPGICQLDWNEFVAYSNLPRYFDHVADKLGHLPFTSDCLRKLADFLVERLRRDAGPTRAIDDGKPAVQDSAALSRFLERLRLRVTCRYMTHQEDFASAARLSHTAATFHASGSKLDEAILRRLAANKDLSLLTVEVSDRFGQYGSTGFLVIHKGDTPVIKEFVLSCVVLGKQVEHVLLHALAQRALQDGVGKLGVVCADLPGGQVRKWVLDIAQRADADLADAGTEVWIEPAKLRHAIAATASSAAMLEEIDVQLPPDCLSGARC